MKIINHYPLFNLLLLLGIITELLYLGFTIFQNSEQSITLYMIVYAAAFIIYFIAYLFIKYQSKDEIKLLSSKSITLIFIFGMIFRATLLPTVPSTSDDVYRYIWEGKLVFHGENPFAKAPNSPELDHLHTDQFPDLVTYKDMTTIYPAAAQVIFMLSYMISGESDLGLKLIYLLAEILTFIFLIKILELRKLNRNLLLVYSWLPLPIMEYFVNSHIDVVGISFFVMFIYFMLKDKYLAAVLPFAISVLIKLYPLMIFPLLMKKLRLKNFIIFSSILMFLIIAGMFPFIPTERSVNASLFTYLSTWSFNGSFYSLFNLIFNESTARSIVLVLLMVAVGNIAIRYNDFLKGVYGVWICFIMFAATLYPWYLGWAAALNPMFGYYSLFSFFFTNNLTNLTPLSAEWQEYWWVYLIQYIPFYLLLLREFYKTVLKTD
jgi:alpha-1,6-mannosyltransferase